MALLAQRTRDRQSIRCGTVCGGILALVLPPDDDGEHGGYSRGYGAWFPPGWTRAWSKPVGSGEVPMWFQSARSRRRRLRGHAPEAGAFYREQLVPHAADEYVPEGWLIALPALARCPDCGFVNLIDPDALKIPTRLGEGATERRRALYSEEQARWRLLRTK